jgi:hypothetical protein
MTDKLRAAAEMALEALESEIEFPKTGPALTMMKDSVEALRQALAEPDVRKNRITEWQGLTDGEIEACINSRGGFVEEFARAIEAKLKEKNYDTRI